MKAVTGYHGDRVAAGGGAVPIGACATTTLLETWLRQSGDFRRKEKPVPSLAGRWRRVESGGCVRFGKSGIDTAGRGSSRMCGRVELTVHAVVPHVPISGRPGPCRKRLSGLWGSRSSEDRASRAQLGEHFLCMVLSVRPVALLMLFRTIPYPRNLEEKRAGKIHSVCSQAPLALWHSIFLYFFHLF
jgi:hypothetical protein